MAKIIRRQVFLRELKFLEKDSSTDKFHKIVSEIFDNDWSEKRSIYTLKSHLKSLNEIQVILQTLNIDDILIKNISSLFDLPNDDLRIPHKLLENLIHKEPVQKVAIFVGAGASKALGIPTWIELSHFAIDYLATLYNYSYAQVQYLKSNIIDPKQIMTLFDNKASHEEKKYFYRKHLVERENSENKNIYPFLAKLNCIKLTTNLDNCFWEACYKNQTNLNTFDHNLVEDKINKVEKILIPNLTTKEIKNLKNTISDKDVYHIHGHVDDIEKAIMTLPKYIEAYYREDAPVYKFLDYIFKNYQILFIGTSLEEFVILESLLKSNIIERKGLQNWALLPAFSTHISEFQLYEDYLNHFKIIPLPYYKDISSFDRLYEVIENWDEQINDIKSKPPSESFIKLKEWTNGDQNNFAYVHEIIKDNDNLQDYFFKISDNHKLIGTLNEYGYFNLNYIPSISIEDGKTRFLKDWPILSYVFRSIDSLNKLHDNNELSIVLNFIEKLSTQHLNNPQVIYWLSIILPKISSRNINLKMIRSIESWIIDQQTAKFISSNIAVDLLNNLSNAEPQKALTLIELISNIKSEKNQSTLEYMKNTHNFLLDNYWVKEGLYKNIKVASKDYFEQCVKLFKDNIKKTIYFEIENRVVSKEYKAFECSMNVLLNSDRSHSILCIIYMHGSKLVEKSFPASSSRNFIKDEINNILQQQSIEDEQREQVSTIIRIVHCSIFSEYCSSAIDDKSYFDQYTDNALCISICYLRDLLLNTNYKNDLKIILKEFLNDELLLFPKIALHTLAKSHCNIPELFWDALESKNSDCIFEELYFGSELDKALKAIIPLNEKQSHMIENRIEFGSILWSDDFPANTEYKDYWKQKRYGSLRDVEYFNALYEKYKLITKNEAELTAAFGPIIVSWGGHDPSPYSKEQIFNLKPNELVKKINNFKDSKKYGQTTSEGFSNLIQSCVEENPEYFFSDLNQFLDVGYLWASKIISGLKIHIKNNPNIYLSLFIQFSNKYIAKEGFYDDKLNVIETDGIFRYSHGSVIESICSIIYDISNLKDDEFKEITSYTSPILDICITLITNIKWTEHNYKDHDYVTYAINTTEGKLCESFLRFYIATKHNFPDKNFISDLDSKIEKYIATLVQINNKSCLIIYGMYLPYLCQFNSNLYLNIITEIKKESSLKYIAAGYTHSAKYYDNIYDTTKNGLKYLIEDSNTTKSDKRSAIEYVTLAFLRNKEILSKRNSFFKKIILCDYENLISAANFVSKVAYDLREIPDKSKLNFYDIISNNTVQFWEFLLNNLEIKKIKLDKYQQSVLAGIMIDFVQYNKEIDVNLESLIIKTIRLGLSEVRYLKNFYDYLLHATANDLYLTTLGKILLELSKEHNPYNLDESLISLIKVLYDNELTKSVAEEVIHIYVEKGHYQLLEIINSAK